MPHEHTCNTCGQMHIIEATDEPNFDGHLLESPPIYLPKPIRKRYYRQECEKSTGRQPCYLLTALQNRDLRTEVIAQTLQIVFSQNPATGSNL